MSFTRSTQFPPTAWHVARVFYLRPAAVKMKMPRETYFSINPRLQSNRLEWHTSHAHLKRRSSLHQVHLLLQHVHFTVTCQPWDTTPSSFFIPPPIHVSPLVLGEMDGQPLQPETGPAQAAPPALQRGEAVNIRKPLAVGLGQGMGKTMGRIWILTLKHLNDNQWDQALRYQTVGPTSRQLCNAPTAESLFRGETRFHELPLHFCQIKKNPNTHELHKGQSLWLIKQKQAQRKPRVWLTLCQISLPLRLLKFILYR